MERGTEVGGFGAFTLRPFDCAQDRLRSGEPQDRQAGSGGAERGEGERLASGTGSPLTLILSPRLWGEGGSRSSPFGCAQDGPAGAAGEERGEGERLASGTGSPSP